MLWLKSQDLPHAQIARLAGVTTRTVQRVLNEFLQGRLERIEENRYVGAPSQLNAHAPSVNAAFEKHPPLPLSPKRNKVLRHLTGIVPSDTQVRAFVKRLGLRRLTWGGVPGKVAQAKQQEQRGFVEQRLNPALDEAKSDQRKIFC